MSDSQVLNAPTYLTTLAPNDAVQDPNFCNQCKFTALTVLFKKNHNSWTPEKAVLPQTHLICYAPNTQDTLCDFFLAEMVAIKDMLTLEIGYPSSSGSSFVIEIQTHARRIELERIC